MALADDRFKVIEEDVILVGLANLDAARQARSIPLIPDYMKKNIEDHQPADDQEADTDYN